MTGAGGMVAPVTGGSRRIGAAIRRDPAKAERRGIRTPEGVAKAVLHFAHGEL